ncbi:Wzz/FepE/Etk N-terminal domain-containing protein [Gammaproteobacteria bacterium]|nr:Wzz/FepE/Etk N-terminal domain-containing protein [Gammaproteobacteria bacterium]
MNQNNSNENNQINQEFNLIELINILFKNWKIILFVAIPITIISAINVYNKPDIYMSSSVLMPADSLSSSKSIPSGLSNLASLTGISTGPAEVSRVDEGIETLKSFKFFIDLVDEPDLIIDLLSYEGWDAKSNKILVDEEIYNADSKTWYSKNPDLKKPSMEDAYKKFHENLSIIEDQDKGFIRLSYEHYSPFLAKKWLDLIINKINLSSRQYDNEESKKSILYLTNQIANTSISEVKSTITNLLEAEIKKQMLSEISSDYLLKIIDPPMIPEKKIKPSRSIQIFLGFIVGIFIGVLIVLIKFFVKTSKQNF